MNQENTAAPKPVVRIDNWSLMLPRSYQGYLTGRVYGHPKIENGKLVYTSAIQGSTENLKEGDIVETRNTLYKLGQQYQVTRVSTEGVQ